MKGSPMPSNGWCLLVLAVLTGFMSETPAQGTMVDVNPDHCFYMLDSLNTAFNFDGSIAMPQIRRYHFRGEARIGCHDPITVDTNAKYGYEVIAYWDTGTKTAKEHVTIGEKKFTLVYSCRKDPWLEAGLCHSPRIEGASPPALISRYEVKGPMASLMRDALTPGATYTSRMWPDNERKYFAAQLACMTPPQITAFHLAVPVMGTATENRLKPTVKAQIPDDLSPATWLWVNLKYVLVPGLTQGPITVTPPENSGQWDSRFKYPYTHAADGWTFDNLEIEIPANVTQGAVAARARLCLGKDCNSYRSGWSDLKFYFFSRDSSPWPSNTNSRPKPPSLDDSN